jgi:hypothetical protein
MATLRTRTQAQRDAINARAAAYPDPLSAFQLEALCEMAIKSLSRGRAGWGSDRVLGKYWQSQTITALEKRGLCRIANGNRYAVITAKGRAEIVRHHPSVRGAP